MKNRLFIILAAAVMVMACDGRTYDVEVIPIQDNAHPRLMANPQESLLAMAKAYEGRLRTFGIADPLPCGVEAVEAYGHTADHEQSVNTRKEILKMGMDNGLILYGMHFPSPYFITNPCATSKRQLL